MKATRFFSTLFFSPLFLSGVGITMSSLVVAESNYKHSAQQSAQYGDRHGDRSADRYTDRRSDRYGYRDSDRDNDKYADRRNDRHNDRHNDRDNDRRADRYPVCKTYEQWQGEGKITILDFRGNDPTSPLLFRLKYNSFESVPADGFMGAVTRGAMTFSWPRHSNPEKAYVKGAPFPAPYIQGPAFGERVSYQAREVACNVFEIHWKEPNKGDTVTQVQDFGRQQVCANITNLYTKPIPADFDPFDLKNQMNNRALFPQGSPVGADDFGFFPLCGKMLQSLEKNRVWEDKFGFLVYEPDEKQQVIDLLKSIETGASGPAASINPNKYIQHNLAVGDGLAGLNAVLQALPAGSAKVNTVRVFQDGDYVFAHTDYNLFGPKIGFDIFRFEDGKIVEHWDNLQEKAGQLNPSGRSMIDGPTQSEDLGKTATNKALVKGFLEEVLVAGASQQLTKYVNSEKYLQHNPAVGDGLAALGAALEAMAKAGTPMKYHRVHKVLGEGNFVLSVSEGEFLGKKSAFYDLFRLENGKIVEHWDTIETIPPRSEWKNGNGKF